uniref:Male-enhanced antigen 1 n=1 Tax=Trichuris muris TaxID=70415 RepID=A0A5S6R1U9_TRIMR
MTIERRLPEPLSPSTDVSDVGEESDLESDYELLGEIDVEDGSIPNLGNFINHPVVINLFDFSRGSQNDATPTADAPQSEDEEIDLSRWRSAPVPLLDSETANPNSSGGVAGGHVGGSMIMRECMGGLPIPEELVPEWAALVPENVWRGFVRASTNERNDHQVN